MNHPLHRDRFVLRGLRVETCRTGQPFTACKLSLASSGASWPAYWWQRFPYSTIWPDGVEVVATVRPRRRNDCWVLDVLDLEVAALATSVPDPVSRQLPFPQWLLPTTEQPLLLRQLWAQLSMMQDPWLRALNQRILHDPDISVRWVRVPASRSHHHAEPSGLLRHSVEAMNLVPQSAQLSPQEWEIARTAVLWHDVGKILAYPGLARRGPAEGELSGHEMAITEVLAAHLAWLRQRAPELVTALKLHWYPPRYGRPLMPGRILVEACDRVSAALDSREQVFLGQPDWRQWGQLEGPGPVTRFWRLRKGLSGASPSPHLQRSDHQ